MTYRTPDLAAECDALRAEVAALRAKPATRRASRARTVAEWVAAGLAAIVAATALVALDAVACKHVTGRWPMAVDAPAEGSAR